MTEILPTASAYAESSDFTIPIGGQVIFHLKDAAGPDIGGAVNVLLQIKSGTQYFTMFILTNSNPGTIMSGGETITTWRAVRLASPDSTGLERV